MIRAAILAAMLLPNIAMAQQPDPWEFDGKSIPDKSHRVYCNWLQNDPMEHCILDPRQVVIDNLNDFIKPEISGANDEGKLACVGIDGSEFSICKPSKGK